MSSLQFLSRICRVILHLVWLQFWSLSELFGPINRFFEEILCVFTVIKRMISLVVLITQPSQVKRIFYLVCVASCCRIIEWFFRCCQTKQIFKFLTLCGKSPTLTVQNNWMSWRFWHYLKLNSSLKPVIILFLRSFSSLIKLTRQIYTSIFKNFFLILRRKSLIFTLIHRFRFFRQQIKLLFSISKFFLLQVWG